MRTVTGQAAADMMDAVKHSVTATDTIYDYEIPDGYVLIRKRDHQCIYIKQCGRKVIAVEGSVQDFAALGYIDQTEIQEMIQTAETLPRLS